MGDVLPFALTAAVYPTLVAATTLMLLLPNPKRLMLGYLLGAMTTSVTLGLVIVFALEDSAAVKTTQHTLSPSADLALGALALLSAAVLGTGREQPIVDRRREHRAAKPHEPPRWQRALDRGSARVTFVVGACLTLPGASYLAGLSRISRLDYSTADTVAMVVGFNLVMLMLLELPLLGYLVAPNATPRAVDRIKAWLRSHGRRAAVVGLLVVGVALILRGVIGLAA